MKHQKILIAVLMTILAVTFKAAAQDITNNKYGKGIKVVAQDSSFSLKFGARIQSLYVGVLDTETKEYTDKFLIRRARLKFEGFAYSPKLTYKIELGLSNSDTGGPIAEANNTANVILDAVLKYNFYKNWSVWAGQTKLPGNLERVISSSKLQFVDRSNLNSKYNIDRDMGVQLRYEGERFRSMSSISNGEGRNITAANLGGYDYTQRFEWLPFGKFKGEGEYFGGDLKREPSPKLMIGVTYDFNDRASREKGQTGKFMSEQRSLESWFVDTHFKHNGWSGMVEYAHKTAKEGWALEDNGNFVESFYVGTGANAQVGYLFKNNFEVAARYTDIRPSEGTQHNDNQQYTLGLSKYIVGHSLKVQTDATLIKEDTKSDKLMYRFQIEFSL